MTRDEILKLNRLKLDDEVGERLFSVDEDTFKAKNYSANMDNAMLVVDEMRERGYKIEFDLIASPNQLSLITIRKRVGIDLARNPYAFLLQLCGKQGEEAKLICQSALLALEKQQ